MPEFAWRAANSAGKVEEGRFTAATPAQVLKHLRDQGMTPLHIGDAGAAVPLPGTAGQAASLGRFAQPKGRQARGPVTAPDVLALTSELAIMLRAGLALDNALRVLIDMSHKPSLAALVQGILDAVKGGTPLSRALAAHRDLFGDFYINMIRSGEASGQMSAVLDRLVEHMERQRALRDSVISATIYPAILLGVAVLSLIAMLGFVVPQFEKLFTDMGDALPLPTRLVMGLGHAFTQYGLVVAAVLAGLGWAALRWLKSPAGRRWWQTLVLRLPLMGPLALKYQLTLFSRSLGTLLGNGVPMLTALHIATETVGNTVLQDALGRVAPIVKEGGKVVQAVTATGIFAPLAINLIRVGEETGRIGPMMLELSNILNREVETGIKRLLTLVEPVLILVLGVLIAAIIVSILLGILSINDLAI
ncbi:general secretion pathway protein F [Acidovorax delafieldii]|uniref:General secretion pathway protein F n=1 Tax=Acidovorax delafieldii TaxID=47920 RepID=A0AAJ2F336_ACIDE|nr:type II secretion system F family protein [Acidovorax delafieldii]MDR6765753.1 general secretion pathway protein F [Acidovorax delafieldii]MDR6836190.1 general secretion pathway protein F [Acidovorax delafieldii]MDR7364839.1 general secretion pathway protein F [Acidovorax delafieldii]